LTTSADHFSGAGNNRRIGNAQQQLVLEALRDYLNPEAFNRELDAHTAKRKA